MKFCEDGPRFRPVTQFVRDKLLVSRVTYSSFRPQLGPVLYKTFMVEIYGFS